MQIRQKIIIMALPDLIMLISMSAC